MRRCFIWPGLAVALLSVLVACQSELPTTPTLEGVASPDKGPKYETGTCDIYLHNKLEAYWENDTGIIFAVIDGAIDRDTGGELVWTVLAWGPEYEVRLRVAPNAIPADYRPDDQVIIFTIVVPVFCLDADPVDQRTSVPYYFTPDNIQFEGSVELVLAWPPWAGEPPTSGYSMRRMALEEHEGGTHYRVLQQFYAVPEETVVESLQDKDGQVPVPWVTGIRTAVDHFSRWELAEGDVPPEIPPIFGLDSYGEEDLEACWTDNDDPPVRPEHPSPVFQ